MGQITFKAGEDYAIKLAALAGRSEEIVKRALYEAADIVTDKIRENIEGLPEDSFRYLKNGDTLSGPTEGQKDDLLDSLGITPIEQDKSGWWNVKVGFDGYGSFPTRKYPQGLPNQLLARATESGSSVRQKHPFVRPAVDATKKAAVAAMQNVVDNECKKTMKGS